MLVLGFLYLRASLVVQRLKRLPAMWETWVRSLGREDPLEKEMATHSSILAWRVPWMEELGGLQSMGRKESDTTERCHFHYKPRQKQDWEQTVAQIINSLLPNSDLN